MKRPIRRGSQPQRVAESMRDFQRRQRRDTMFGIAGMIISGIVLILNLIMEIDNSIMLLPGGHSEVYFLAGLVAFAYAAWIKFDLGLNRRKRR